MQSQVAHPDFVLFPRDSQKQLKMLALESSRQQQLTYYQPYTMDPALINPFGFQVDQLGGFGQNQDPSGLSQSYYDAPVYAESGPDINKSSGFPSATPPLMTTSQPTEHGMPGLSSASGPSIASASSSAIGSPYSGNVQAFPENWVDTSHGLGLQAAVVGDLFPNDYMSGTADPEGFYQKKSQDNYVGESQDISSDVQSTFPISALRHECSLSTFQVATSGEEAKPSLYNISATATASPAPCRGYATSIAPVSQRIASPSPGVPLFTSPSTSASARMSTPSIHSPVLAGMDRPQPMADRCSTIATCRGPTVSPKSSSRSIPSSMFPGSFFQQSSGNFVPPLVSSCRFSLRYPCSDLHLPLTFCYQNIHLYIKSSFLIKR